MLLGVGTTPSFAIGQRALLVRSAAGNVLWDCISLIDEATHDLIAALGGVSAIAISHPHFYSGMVEWSRAFGGAPIYLHEADRPWVMRPDPAIRFWSGETLELMDGLTLVRCGGHFEGGTVLHWPAGSGGRGALLSGDIVQVVQDSRYVSFMYSYPNLIPLPAAAGARIVTMLEPFAFEELYGAWWGRIVRDDAHRAVRESALRYIAALSGTGAR
ncbi:MAG: MBL fold metallo-hydrolase [Gemmatimonadaceae bacterium]